MATTKKTTEMIEETPVVEQDPWKIMKTLALPRGSKSEAKSMYIAVNGKAYNVPKGKPTEVPLPIYEVGMRHLAARQAMIDVESEIPNEG